MIRRPLAILWASPGSFVGLTAGLLGLCTGGRVRRVGHTLEFHGGFLKWLLKRLPVEAIAMTLGHVIIGQTQAGLEDYSAARRILKKHEAKMLLRS